MADFEFEDPFDETVEEILESLFEQVDILWPDPDNRPDLREGTLMWTLLSPIAYEIQRFQQDLNLALELGFIQFTFGEFLDLRGQEIGLDRNSGAVSEGFLRFLGNLGTVIPTGTTASTVATSGDDESFLFDTNEVGTIVGVSSPTSLNEEQEISATGTAGAQFTLVFDGSRTTPLQLTDDGATLAAAINALDPTTNYVGYTVSGDSGIVNAGGATLTFDTGAVSNTDVPLIELDPYHETQQFQITGSGTFNVTFDGTTGGVVLAETDTGTDLVNAINALAPTLNYSAFTVSTTSGATALNDPGGVDIIFDGGDVEHEDVPALGISVVSGSPALSITSSSVSGTVEETVKGRGATANTLTTSTNEIQTLSFTQADDLTTQTQQGQPGPQNEVQRITFSGTPLTGKVNLIFNDGVTSETTIDIEETFNAANIENALNALPNVSSGDITVTTVSGGPTIDGGNLVVDVEFGGSLRYETYGLMTTTGNTFAPGTTVNITRIFSGQNGQNEKQRLEYVDGVPTGGTVAITIEDNDGSGTETVTDLPYNFTAGELQSELENLTIYANSGSDPSGTNFTVTGGPLDSAPIFIEYKGINRYKDFKNAIISQQTTGTPTSGDFRLVFDDTGSNPQSTVDIAYDADTAEVETALEGASNIGAGNVLVTVATGFQTIEFDAAPTSGTFDITVDDGTSALTTGPIAYNASAATVQTEIEGLANVGAGNVIVETSGSTLDLGSTYTVHMLKPDTTYRHFTTTQPTAMSPATNILIGPTLDVAGAGYIVEFNNALSDTNFALMDYDIDAPATPLAPEPNEVVLETVENGGVGVNERQLVSLSHPSGFFKLNYGSTAPTQTHFISPLLDDNTSIEHKLERLGDITVGDLTVTGGPVNISDLTIEFGGSLAATDVVLLAASPNTVGGGTLIGPLETEKGHDDGSGAGAVTGDVRYGYTLVTKLGVQESTDDPDFEEGFGETALSTLSPVITVNNVNVRLNIAPVIRTDGIYAIRKVNVYRSLNSGPFKLLGSIPESEISFTSLGNEDTVADMYFVDNISAPEFAAITTTAPTANTTGVVDIPAESQEVLDDDGNILGASQNVAARTITVLEDSIAGVTAVTNPEPFGGGVDVEDDESYRARLIEEAQKDPGAGNVDDYVSWAQQIDGVESVSVIPEWQEIYGPLEGPGTVKVIVAGPDSTILDDSTVDEVREFIAGTTAIPDPDQTAAPATSPQSGGSIENGVYEYVYTFINVGKGETAPSPPSRITVGLGDNAGNNTVELFMEQGQGGVGVQNTIGRRVYRRKVDGIVPNEPESDRFVLVAEILNNIDTSYVDSADFASLPTWTGYPDGPYERRKAPEVNSTSLFDGEAPIGAHVTVQSITDETIWVNSTIYPEVGYSVDGSGGTINLTSLIDANLRNYFTTLEAGEDVLITEIQNVIHDTEGVKDFKDTVLVSPAFPVGTTSNIPIGPGIVALYSSAGVFNTWTNYPFDP